MLHNQNIASKHDSGECLFASLFNMSLKRERTYNFTRDQKDLLITLIQENEIIESKEASLNVIQRKKIAWVEISAEWICSISKYAIAS